MRPDILARAYASLEATPKTLPRRHHSAPERTPASQPWNADTRTPIEVNRFADGGFVDRLPDALAPTLHYVAPASEAAAAYKPGLFDDLIPAPPPGFEIVDDAPWTKYAAAEAEAKRKTASAAGPSEWDQFPRAPSAAGPSEWGQFPRVSPPLIVEFEGQRHEFPDDFTDQDISSAWPVLPRPSRLQRSPIPCQTHPTPTRRPSRG